jgi:hypothetical protein
MRPSAVEILRGIFYGAVTTFTLNHYEVFEPTPAPCVKCGAVPEPQWKTELVGTKRASLLETKGMPQPETKGVPNAETKTDASNASYASSLCVLFFAPKTHREPELDSFLLLGIDWSRTSSIKTAFETWLGPE